MSILRELLRRPARRGKSPAMSLVFSDCAYVVFDRLKDAELFAVHAMRSFMLNDMPALGVEAAEKMRAAVVPGRGGVKSGGKIA